MNKRALVYGMAYCAIAIAFKLYILLGGYTLTDFGFTYSHLVSILLIIPFFFYAVYQVREKDMNGIIGGREAMRVSLTILALAVVVMSIYNYIEFDWKYRDIAIRYYNSDKYLETLVKIQERNPAKLKTEDFPKIIAEQLSGLSAFKATTGKLIPMLFFGLTGAFMCSTFLKRSPK